MTTSQLDIQISGQREKLARLQPLIEQYEAMKSAAKEAKVVEARLAALLARQEKETADVLAGCMAAITAMSVTGISRQDAITVTVTKRSGEHYTKSLRSLDNVERQVLFTRYWMSVPADVRALGDTPAEALREYAAAKLRGWFKG